MNNQEKIDKLKAFKTEREFREFLIDLLKKMGFKNVFHSHRYGAPELGKDIIAQWEHDLEGAEWYAFVVKVGRIGGGSTEIETIKNQIKQSFEYPYINISGEKQNINKVKVVTNENFTGGAQHSLSASPELSIYRNFDFWWNDKLIDFIDRHYIDFWLPGDLFSKEYIKNVEAKIHEEFELKELSLRQIEDKKIKKLLEIFVEPRLIESLVSDKDGREDGRKMERKSISINAIMNSSDCFIMTGDPGSGKTKIINNLTHSLLDLGRINEQRIIPVKLRGKELREKNFDISATVRDNILGYTPDFSDQINTFRKIILVDEIDMLSAEEKQLLAQNLDDYCTQGGRFILAQRSNDNLDFKLKNVRNVRITNFNVKQIELFIGMYFHGTDRGERFVQILKESNILSKLPMTPLTITLISLLYDENNYEVPATITDIYDDFIKVLLGKLEVKSKSDLLVFNLKRRLFTVVALRMLDNNQVEMSQEEFRDIINSFLKERGYQIQNDKEILQIISNSGLLYIDHRGKIEFKQQAFIEYLASIEIYDNARETHYNKMLEQFNLPSWQNTAIFFAGKSKEVYGLIDNLLSRMPNENMGDWMINTGGMGYLAQALYLSPAIERKKLVRKSLENMVAVFYEFKKLSELKEGFISGFSMPLIASVLSFWFTENFRSITLRETLSEVFEDLIQEFPNPDVHAFDPDFQLFLVASTLMDKYIGDEDHFYRLLERDSFIKNPVLMIAGDTFLETGVAQKTKNSKEAKAKIDKNIRIHIKIIKNIVKEPAYRFDNDYRLLDKERSEDSE